MNVNRNNLPERTNLTSRIQRIISSKQHWAQWVAFLVVSSLTLFFLSFIYPKYAMQLPIIGVFNLGFSFCGDFALLNVKTTANKAQLSDIHYTILGLLAKFVMLFLSACLVFGLYFRDQRNNNQSVAPDVSPVETYTRAPTNSPEVPLIDETQVTEETDYQTPSSSTPLASEVEATYEYITCEVTVLVNSHIREKANTLSAIISVVNPNSTFIATGLAQVIPYNGYELWYYVLVPELEDREGGFIYSELVYVDDCDLEPRLIRYTPTPLPSITPINTATSTSVPVFSTNTALPPTAVVIQPTVDITEEVEPSHTPHMTEEVQTTLTPTAISTEEVLPSLTPTVFVTEEVEPSLTPHVTDEVQPTLTPTAISTEEVQPSLTPTVFITEEVEPSLTPHVTDEVLPSLTPTAISTEEVEPSLTPHVTDEVQPTLTPTIHITETLIPTDIPSDVFTVCWWKHETIDNELSSIWIVQNNTVTPITADYSIFNTDNNSVSSNVEYAFNLGETQLITDFAHRIVINWYLNGMQHTISAIENNTGVCEDK